MNSQQTASTSCPPPHCQILEILGGGNKNQIRLPAELVGFVVNSPSERSLRKLFGISGCNKSPPSENTVFMVSINHSLSGAYVRKYIGKK